MTTINEITATHKAQIEAGIEATKNELRAAVDARVNKAALVKLLGEDKAQIGLDAAWAAVEAELAGNTIDGCEDWFRDAVVATRRLMTAAATAAKASVK